ncbi:MAG: hypothetical protein JNG86_16225 [Verrucomicrobiaceae bacterium]|nr:hypothetical protein [Verrucomicrobiaceae bacterium]
MQSGSTGSHRAFMGVAVTFSVCLVLTLVVGWRWYFQSVQSRTVLLERTQRNEARIRELEKLGLDAEAGIIQDDSAAPAMSSVSLQDTAVTPAPAAAGPVPGESSFKELPLQESAADFVDALAVIEGYWKAANTKERLVYVFDAPRVGPLMQDHYEQQKETDPDHTELKQKSRFLLDGHEILYFSYASSRPTGLCEVAMRRHTNGRFLIDWESLAGHSSLSFAKIRETKPVTPVLVRAFVRPFEYYNYEFTDSKRYICIKLIAANGVDTLYGYAERASPVGEWLVARLDPKSTAMSGYTLKIAFPENPQSDQCVNITQIIAARWLMLD